jgi:F-type H+-transporting ATPase subunit epsilon
MPLRLEIVTAEREILAEDDVDEVIVPGADGQLTIRPHHASLISLLAPGELRVRQRGTERIYAITGGFMEVHRSRVRILADAAEHADEIDIARAQAAEERARQLIADRRQVSEIPVAYAALRRSQVRLRVARRRRSNAPPGSLAG